MKIFDQLHFKGRPQPFTTLPGFEACSQTDRMFLDRRYSQGRDTGARGNEINFEELELWAKSAADVAILDMEDFQWKEGFESKSRHVMFDFRVPGATLDQIKKDVTGIISMLRVIRKAGKRAGFYGAPSAFNIQNAVIEQNTAALMQALQADDILAVLGFWNEVDVKAPTIYTTTDNVSLWTRVAEIVIRRAKAPGIPVLPIMPFISPQFHHSVWSKFGTLVSLDFWKAMLQFCEVNDLTPIAWCSGVVNEEELKPYIELAQKFTAPPAPVVTTVDAKALKPSGKRQ